MVLPWLSIAACEGFKAVCERLVAGGKVAFVVRNCCYNLIIVCWGNARKHFAIVLEM